MKFDEIIKGLRPLENGLSPEAELWVPNLEWLNRLRAEEGLPALSRAEVPENIHFASELPEDFWK